MGATIRKPGYLEAGRSLSHRRETRREGVAMVFRFARAPQFLVLSTFLILASARADAAAPITGRVVDEAGRPVPGARVFVSSGAMR